MEFFPRMPVWLVFLFISKLYYLIYSHHQNYRIVYIYIYIYINKLSMVKNLLIARKTCRPREGVGMFIIIKKKSFLNDRFRLALVKILTPEKKVH